MEHATGIALLKSNFRKVEEKFTDFFAQGAPRWPGETHDLLRNHHKNIDDLSLKTITFEHLAFSDLPEHIMKELADAFDAFKKGNTYS